MNPIQRIGAIPRGQKYRYALILVAAALLLAPFTLIPSLFHNPDLCGPLCMRRFYLWFPGMTPNDLWNQIGIAAVGAGFLLIILVTTFFFGRIWCAYLCPMGGVPELLSRITGERWKIEYRWLPQVPIRYGYFLTFVLLMPMMGVSACTLCNFITVPRIFQLASGDWRGAAYLITTVGMVNLGLVLLLGLFANKGRGYCAFLCPIGAIDALVNRLGSHFRFTRRIRVERERCTGCNECARKCMCGAITMVDRVAVVDQLSCMSCHECADVCDWGAIDWLTIAPEIEPRRRKKDVTFHPQPQWVALHLPRKKRLRWQRILLWSLVLLVVLLAWSRATAAPRSLDPDGCLVCHGLQGLEFIDTEGVMRQLVIDRKHYRRSLHGAVPCSDCHREIRFFPHREDKGVDCTAQCHIEEPSRGNAYTHKEIAEEMEDSVHRKGATKGFTGSNRLHESRNHSSPSCRLCHSNTGYISEAQMPRFRELFAHSEKSCGNCHRDEIWRERFTGHVLRRLLEGRWSKAESNRLCDKCHADPKRMGEVKREAGRQSPEPVSARFVNASASYSLTLHGRLIAAGRESGAGCIDCHAPDGLHHGIEAHEWEKAATNETQLAKTCSQSDCHGFAADPRNKGFLHTDLHDLDLTPLLYQSVSDAPSQWMDRSSPWFIALVILGVLTGTMTIIWISGQLLGDGSSRGKPYAFLGGGIFKHHMLEMKSRKKGGNRSQR